MTMYALMRSIAPDPMSSSVVHVAVGVIRNPQGDILIAKRPSHVHQGGLWEFPGGKVEAGEPLQVALQRELHEELDIDIKQCRPLIRIPHRYPDKQVLLDVWLVEAFNGVPHGKENQPIEWRQASELWNLPFPVANRPIVQAVNLPESYLITGMFADTADFIRKLRYALKNGVKLVQFRAKDQASDAFVSLAKSATDVCHEYGARLLINADPKMVELVGSDGVHLNSERLMALSSRPLGTNKLVAASVHNQEQLEQAERLELDFTVISPVLPTPSHPHARVLNWDGFQTLTEQATHPVYALGGMKAEHLPEVWQHGGQGIAAIRSLWK